MSIKKIKASGKSVLIIGDLHAPYHHKDALRFLEAVKKKYLNQKSIIINIGDEVDNHAISFHETIAELHSAGHELEKAIQFMQSLRGLFPRLILLNSNHGSLVFRRLKAAGLPIKIAKDLTALYDCPKWKWYDELILTTNNVLATYLCHGKKSGYNALAKEVGLNAIQGHYHSKFEITYFRTPTFTRYNAFCGCLIDYESLAFEYGKNHLPKPVLGVILIKKSGTPKLIKMDLDESGRWTGKLI